MRELLAVGQHVQRPRALAVLNKKARIQLSNCRWSMQTHMRLWDWLFWLIGPFVALVATSQWFTPGFLLGGGDNFPGVYPNPGNWLARLPYSWDLTGIGGPTGLIVQAPQIIIISLLRLVFDPAGAQHAFYALLLAAEILSMVFLILTIFPGHRLASLLGALFYTFNPATVTVPPGFVGIYVAALLPCIAALFIRTATGPLRLHRLLCFSVITGCSGFLFMNPPTFAILLMFFSLLAVYVIIRDRATKGRVVRRVILLATIALLSNAYWIPSGYFSIFGLVHQGVGGLAATVDSYGFVSSRASILNLFWLNSTWAWDAYFPYSVVYRTPLFLSIIFIPTLLAFSALLNRSIPRPIVYSASVIALITLFLCTGQHQPWAPINLFLFHHVPLYWLFREPNTKFIYVLLVVYAILVGYQAEWVVQRVARMVRQRMAAAATHAGIAVVFAGVFLLLGFPLVTGASVGRGNGATHKTGFLIPHYWYDLGQYLARVGPTDGVLLLPNDDYYQMRYIWGYYGLDGMANEMLSNRVIPVSGELGYISNSQHGSITSRILRMMQNGSPGSIVPYLAGLGVGYIVQRNDIDATEPGRRVLTPSQVRNFLQGQRGIRLVQTFGKLDLYEVDHRYYVPPVYAVSVARSDLTGARLDRAMTRDLETKLSIPSDPAAPAALTVPQVMHLSVTHENPVRYVVHIGPIKGPIQLVLSTSYHPSWHACLVPDGAASPWACAFGGSAPSLTHVHALGFLNGWVINHPGRYTVIIDYGFQYIADFSMLITMLTLGGLLLSCLAQWLLSLRRTLLPAQAGVLRSHNIQPETAVGDV